MSVQCLHELADGGDGLVAAEPLVATEQLPGEDVGGDDELGDAPLAVSAAQPREGRSENVLDPLLVAPPPERETGPDDRDALLDRERAQVKSPVCS